MSVFFLAQKRKGYDMRDTKKAGALCDFHTAAPIIGMIFFQKFSVPLPQFLNCFYSCKPFIHCPYSFLQKHPTIDFITCKREKNRLPDLKSGNPFIKCKSCKIIVKLLLSLLVSAYFTVFLYFNL